MQLKAIITQYRQFFKVVFFGLLNNKLRSFLTMLGIIIGVAAVIVIMSVGSGAQNLILEQVESLGSNVVGVLPGKSEESGPPASVMGIVITTLTYDDARAIREERNAPNVVDVVAYSKGISTVTWGNRNIETNLSGTMVGALVVEGGEVAEGRFFTESEEGNLARVAVLGSSVKEDLFGESDPIGRKIKIKKVSFEVIGVMEERGTVAFQDFDDQVFIPISAMQKLIMGVNHVGMIRAKVDFEDNMDTAIADIEQTLRERHDIRDMSGKSDDFTVRNSNEALDMISVITDSLNLFLAAMAALSLVVGGIGIMNIMLISVNERTREIGLRKAVGANNHNILVQFLTESAFLTLFGGMIGVVLGVIFAYLISLSINLLGYDWAFVVSPLSIILGLSIAIFVGVVFGIYPSKKASKFSPMEALRYE
jgi:putative ABC transport system permease protein